MICTNCEEEKANGKAIGEEWLCDDCIEDMQAKDTAWSAYKSR